MVRIPSSQTRHTKAEAQKAQQIESNSPIKQRDAVGRSFPSTWGILSILIGQIGLFGSFLYTQIYAKMKKDKPVNLVQQSVPSYRFARQASGLLGETISWRGPWRLGKAADKVSSW